MRPLGVVVFAPMLDDDLNFSEGCCDPLIAVASELPRQCDHVGDEPIVGGGPVRLRQILSNEKRKFPSGIHE